MLAPDGSASVTAVQTPQSPRIDDQTPIRQQYAPSAHKHHTTVRALTEGRGSGRGGGGDGDGEIKAFFDSVNTDVEAGTRSQVMSPQANASSAHPVDAFLLLNSTATSTSTSFLLNVSPDAFLHLHRTPHKPCVKPCVMLYVVPIHIGC